MSADVPRLITEIDDVHRLVERIYAEGTAYTYDFETLGSRTQRLKVCGIGLAWGPEAAQGAFVLNQHAEHPYVDWEAALEALRPLLEDAGMTQVAHNSLFDAGILDRYGVTLHTNTYDTMVMAWMLNTETPNGLKGLIHQIYGHKMTELTSLADWDVVSWHPGKILRVDRIPIEQFTRYGIEDVIWTYRLWQDALAAIREDPDLDKVYHELYQEYLVILAQMQNDGVALDVEYLKQREAETREELDSTVAALIDMRPGEDFDGDLCRDWTALDIDTRRKQIPALQEKWKDRKVLRPLLYANPTLAHKVFNPGSNHQLNTVLFRELGVKPIGEKTKTGQYSVAAEVLTKLIARDDSGVIKTLLRYSALDKLQGTYHIGMQELVDDDGRVRTRYNPTLKTGRLSSSEPNLMNIPQRTDDGRLIRKAFRARGEDWCLVGADYSQIELRVLAHFSGDAALVEGFRRGNDPHSITAREIFELDCDVAEVAEAYPQQRSIAKTVNFGVVYGVGAETLMTQIIKATGGAVVPTIEEAQYYKDALLTSMPGVRDWIRYQERQAKRHGVVRTLIGRPRHVPDAMEYNPKRARDYYRALRIAVNTAIQGSAADIISIAKRNIRREFMERGWWRELVHLVLQVHDELLFDAHESVVEEVVPRIRWNMENAVALAVPILAKPSVGATWYDTK